MSELAVRVGDLVDAARRRFRVLAAVVAAQSIAWGAVGGWLLWSQLALGATLGAVLALVVFLWVQDWGAKLDNKPRGLNLVRARTGAAAAMVMLPLGPLVALPLLRLLGEPLIASYAVANHPDAGSAPDEDVLATIRVRSAFHLLRAWSFAFAAGAALLVAMAGPLAWGDPYWRTGVVLGLMALLQMLAGFMGTSLLRDITPERVQRVKRLAWLVVCIPPFGSYAAWCTRRAFPNVVLPT